jgi:hypothetical protein
MERALSARWLTPRRETSIFGDVHGFDGVFPTSDGIKPTANSLAMQIGGGLNVGVAKHFGVRALELYCLRPNLTNDAYNTHNDLRLGFGVSYHVGK